MDIFIKTSECRFFEKYFDMYCEVIAGENEEAITFNQFTSICQECDKFNKQSLFTFLETIKRRCRDKLRNKDSDIRINRIDFYSYIEEIIKSNDKVENENDPELKELFDILAINETINKKYFADLIVSFDLPLNVDEFLSPVKKKDDIVFVDFCSLFRRRSHDKNLNMIFNTFTSSFYGKKVRQNEKDDSFPIQFNILS